MTRTGSASGRIGRGTVVSVLDDPCGCRSQLSSQCRCVRSDVCFLGTVGVLGTRECGGAGDKRMIRDAKKSSLKMHEREHGYCAGVTGREVQGAHFFGSMQRCSMHAAACYYSFTVTGKSLASRDCVLGCMEWRVLPCVAPVISPMWCYNTSHVCHLVPSVCNQETGPESLTLASGRGVLHSLDIKELRCFSHTSRQRGTLQP